MNLDEQILGASEGRAFLVGLQRGRQPSFEVEEHLDELAELASSAGFQVAGRAIQRRPAPHPATFIGSGKAREVAAAIAELGGGTAIFDDDLSPSQVNELEKILGVPVIDRSLLILQLFQLRARTSEARTQVELARLNYLLPRLTKYWKHLSRQVGGIGQRGGEGEKQLEMDRRMLRRRIAQLRRKLEGISRTREVQRRGRRKVREVALAGYTNVGKSTLFNRLTNSDARVRNQLFATLDPKLRQGAVGHREVVVFSDTVGFIRKLPHHLVASFRSTLEQVALADLVLHVVDRSHPQWLEQERVAEEVLADLGVDPKRVMTVYNKIDRLDGAAQALVSVDDDGDHGLALSVSAKTGEGIDELREAIRRRLFPGSLPLELAAATADSGEPG